jgi:hypothetical protein
MEHAIGTIKPLPTSWVVDVPHLLRPTLPHLRRFIVSCFQLGKLTYESNFVHFPFLGILYLHEHTRKKLKFDLKSAVNVLWACLTSALLYYSAEQGPIRVSSIL